MAEIAAGRKGREFTYPALENDAQRQFVRAWTEPEAEANATQVKTASDRGIAALLGLALGDAMGTPLEFLPPGTFQPLTDMVGGGPFNLKPGEWTDDTSMALCLAESLVKSKGFDPNDQMETYCRWWQQGHWSVKGKCFDIGATVSEALEKYRATGRSEERRGGKEC